MKKFLRIGRIFAGSAILLAVGVTLYILLTDEYSEAKFRTMQDKISTTESVDLRGLREIQASGGPIVNFPNLKKRLGHIKSEIIIIDALRHHHGYINERPTVFFAYGHQNPDWRHFIRRLIFTGTTQTRPDLIIPEIEVALKYGFGYKNIKIDSKIKTPDVSVDEFVAFFDQLPEAVWVHFHCRLGKGRTSMMLVMLDIMKNAPKVPLTDIVKRQYLLGSENLFNTVARHGGTYHSKTLTQRKKFIEDFYAFICQRKTKEGIQRWSEWRHGKQTPPHIITMH